MLAVTRTLLAASLALAALGGACRSQKAEPAADASPGPSKLRELTPVLRPPEASLPLRPGFVFAGALLSSGEVASRGFFHVDLEGRRVERLPDSWRVPEAARLSASAAGDSVAWVSPEGLVYLVSKSVSAAPGDAGAPSPKAVAKGADPLIAPLFLKDGTFLFALLDGGVAHFTGGRARKVWNGVATRIEAPSLSPDERRLVATGAGELVVVADLVHRRGHTAYRAPGKKTRLFEPRILADGTILVRERVRSRQSLLRIPPAGGNVLRMPLPHGSLRAFEARPDGSLWLGLARRGDRVMLGEVVVVASSLGPKTDGGLEALRLVDGGREREGAHPTDGGAARPSGEDEEDEAPPPAPKPADSKQAEPKHAEPKHAEPKHAEPKHAEPKHAEPKHAAPKHAEPKHAEPKHAEPKHAEPKHAEPKHAEPKHAAPKHAEPKHAEPKHAEPKHAEPKHAEPKHADGGAEPEDAPPSTSELLVGRVLVSLPRTRPAPIPACGDAFVLVDESTTSPRLLHVDVKTGASRPLTPPHLRVVQGRPIAVLCGSR